MTGAGAAALAAAVATTACGGSATSQRDSGSRSPIHARAACPRHAPLRSSPGRPDALAPGHPRTTSYCVYRTRGGRVEHASVYRGGPFDDALNGSLTRLPPRSACSGTATSPVVVVLTYDGKPTRHVVVDVGGCALVTSRGTTRVLWGRPLDVLFAVYEHRG